MKFREHRGTLADSLETMVELQTRQQLMDHIEKLLAPFPFNFALHKITIEPYFMEPDTRCGWAQTYIVVLPGLGPIGFTDALPS